MKLLICNYTGFRANWGSQATSRGLVQFLCTALPEGRIPQIDILPYPPTHWLDHWQSKRHGKLLEEVYATDAPTKAQLDALEHFTEARFGNLLDRIKAADIVFFQGEGTLGSGREFRRTQLFGPLLLAKHRYAKTTISINQSVIFRSAGSERALKAIFGSLDRNYVRELDSFETCKSAGWPEFGFIPDTALFYHPTQTGVPAYAMPYFCITGSADLASYDLEAYARGIDDVAARWNLHPVFVYSRNSDVAVVEAFKKLGNRAFSTITNATHPDVDQMIPVLSGAQVVIGGRYHTSISALSKNVPVILTPSNSRKSVGLAQMFGTENVPLLDCISPQSLVNAMKTLMEDQGALRVRLAGRLDDLKGTARAAAEDIQTFLTAQTSKVHWEDSTYLPHPSLGGAKSRFGLLRTILRTRNLSHYDRNALIQLASSKSVK